MRSWGRHIKYSGVGIIMNIRLTNILSMQNIAKNNQERRLINILLGKNSAGKDRDIFVKSSNMNIYSGIYTANVNKKAGYISKDILALINNDISSIRSEGDVHFLRGGGSFTTDQIPPIDKTGLKEVKAENNCMDFGTNNYFKYISKDGKEHYLYTDNHATGSIFSEFLRGEPFDETLSRYSRFWNYLAMAKDLVYMAETFSWNEMKGFLDEAGIHQGFFTVKMGDHEAARFYSKAENGAMLYSQERYDIQYKSIASTGGLFFKYEPGSVFKIGGDEYVLSENHTLDIPYGADVFDIGYPSNYKYGVKID